MADRNWFTVETNRDVISEHHAVIDTKVKMSEVGYVQFIRAIIIINRVF